MVKAVGCLIIKQIDLLSCINCFYFWYFVNATADTSLHLLLLKSQMQVEHPAFCQPKYLHRIQSLVQEILKIRKLTKKRPGASLSINDVIQPILNVTSPTLIKFIRLLHCHIWKWWLKMSPRVIYHLLYRFTHSSYSIKGPFQSPPSLFVASIHSLFVPSVSFSSEVFPFVYFLCLFKHFFSALYSSSLYMWTSYCSPKRKLF